MGQTLTNGIYLPAEGEVRCYAGLASNWTTLDAVVGGYRAHIANENIHITSAERNKWDTGVTQAYVLRYANTSLTALGTVAFSALDNTDNVKIGDKVLDSEGKLFALTAVDTANSSATLSALLIDLSKDSDLSNYYTKNETDSLLNDKADASALTAHTGDTTIHVTAEDKEAWNGKADASALTAHTGDTTIHVTAEDKQTWDTVTTKANDADAVHKSGAETIAGPKTFSDTVTVPSINGINPGALSLPDISAGVDISGYITAGSTHNEYTPTVDGWISVILKKTTTSGALAIFLYQGDVSNSYFGNTALPNDTEFCGMASIPVKAGAVVNIDLRGSNTYVYSAKFYPCRGNV